jgi:DUF4097 and DUF4098 domain-containing protein YvlB
MKATKLGLLFLLLAFGSTVETAWQVRNRVGPLALGPTGCRVLQGKFHGPSFSFTEERKEAFSDGNTLEVTNAFGAVRIAAGDPGTVAVTLRKVLYRPTEAEAREYAPKVQLQVERAGDVLRLGTNREALEGDFRQDVGFETHFELAVPPETKVKVVNEHGEVRVADVLEADVSSSFDAIVVERIRGPVHIKGRHGDVSASMVRGALKLSNRHGDARLEDVEQNTTVEVEHGTVTAARVAGAVISTTHGGVTAENVTGDLEVRAQHAGVEATDVSGRADVETSFGSVSLRRVGGDARVRAQHGGVRAAEIGGGLDVESSYDGVRLEQVKGPVTVTVEHGGVQGQGLEQGGRLKASGEDVTLDGFKGALDVQVERAGVVLRPGGAVVQALRVSTRHGGIELDVPAGSRFLLKASAQPGEVETDVPGLVITQTGRSRVEGRVGDGSSEVVLSADHGDVHVRAAALVAEKKPDN